MLALCGLTARIWAADRLLPANSMGERTYRALSVRACAQGRCHAMRAVEHRSAPLARSIRSARVDTSVWLLDSRDQILRAALREMEGAREGDTSTQICAAQLLASTRPRPRRIENYVFDFLAH